MKAIVGRLKAAVRHNPVEVILAVLFCFIGCANYDYGKTELEVLLSYFPALFLITYTLNALTGGKRWRFVYYMSLFLFIPFLWKEGDIGSAFWWVTLAVVQLLYLVSDWRSDNEAFIRKVLCYLKALLSAGLLAGVACLLSVSIYFSIRYIFEVYQMAENRFITYSVSVAFAGMMPLLFLMFNQKKEGEEEGGANKLFDVLLNYVLSPALLIYAVILYLYFVKVTVLWSLPKGAVAYIVVSFIAATFLLKGCQPFLGRRYYDWFYRFASLAVLPALAMYWVGTFYRIDEYGFTEPRVYLVVVGAVLTGVVLLFLTRRTGRYLYAAVLTIFLLASVTYVPGITAKDIERISQLKRGNYPMKEDGYGEPTYFSIKDTSPLDITDYRTLQTVWPYADPKGMYATSEKDTLYLYDTDGKEIFKADVQALFDRQLKKAGLSPTDSIPAAAYSAILRIDLDSALFVLNEISIYRYSSDSVYLVSYLQPGYYLKK